MKEKEESSNVDRVILEALAQKEAEDILSYSGDPSLFELMGTTFRGRLRWMVIMSFIMSIVYFGIGIYCAVNFSSAVEMKETIGWACGVLLCMMIVIVHKSGIGGR
jgi:hypothetical protein